MSSRDIATPRRRQSASRWALRTPACDEYGTVDLSPAGSGSTTSSGAVLVNDCTVQPQLTELPFGGVGNSGMGQYHGVWGFEAFTHPRAVYYHSPALDPGVKYPPYAEHQFERRIENKLL
jgi:hypothetical protein